MAAVQLTERQQEIKTLLDKGKTPSEIAKLLGITENAIYQQQRRIRKAMGEKPPRRGSGTKRARSRRPSVAGSAAVAAATPPAQKAELRNMTPLQAIRLRKSEIEAAVKEAEREHADAQKAVLAAGERLTAARAKVADDLARLEAAEAALTGKTAAKPRRQPTRHTNGASAAPDAPQAKAAPGPAPAAQAEAPSPQEAAVTAEERPGVATVPEFAEEEATAPAPGPTGGEDAVALVGAEGFDQSDGFTE